MVCIYTEKLFIYIFLLLTSLLMIPHVATGQPNSIFLSPLIHIVKEGDALEKIAAAHGKTVPELRALNPFLNDNGRVSPNQRKRGMRSYDMLRINEQIILTPAETIIIQQSSELQPSDQKQEQENGQLPRKDPVDEILLEQFSKINKELLDKIKTQDQTIRELKAELRIVTQHGQTPHLLYVGLIAMGSTNVFLLFFLWQTKRPPIVQPRPKNFTKQKNITTNGSNIDSEVTQTSIPIAELSGIPSEDRAKINQYVVAFIKRPRQPLD